MIDNMVVSLALIGRPYLSDSSHENGVSSIEAKIFICRRRRRHRIFDVSGILCVAIFQYSFFILIWLFASQLGETKT